MDHVGPWPAALTTRPTEARCCGRPRSAEISKSAEEEWLGSQAIAGSSIFYRRIAAGLVVVWPGGGVIGCFVCSAKGRSGKGNKIYSMDRGRYVKAGEG